MSARPGHTILVVEDEALIAADLQSTLEGLGYRVPSVVARGADAVAAVDSVQPDLVLMDICLRGDWDGVETAERVKARRDVPIVFLTSHSDTATLQRAKATGPRAYLLKPFTEENLRITIEVTLHTHELERRLARAERQAAIAGLAGSIAHDINNPLAALSGNVGYAREQVRALLERPSEGGLDQATLDELREVLEDVKHDAERIQRTVRDLGMLAEGDASPRSVVSLEQPASSAAAVASGKVKARARLEVSIDPEARALASEGLVMQLACHLLLRAAFACEGVPDPLVRLAVSVRDGASVLQVTDTGRPMSADEVRRVADPLPTTANYSVLPGLTLALASRIAGELGASLSVRSDSSLGTVVEVAFPPVG